MSQCSGFPCHMKFVLYMANYRNKIVRSVLINKVVKIHACYMYGSLLDVCRKQGLQVALAGTRFTQLFG